MCVSVGMHMGGTCARVSVRVDAYTCMRESVMGEYACARVRVYTCMCKRVHAWESVAHVGRLPSVCVCLLRRGECSCLLLGCNPKDKQ